MPNQTRPNAVLLQRCPFCRSLLLVLVCLVGLSLLSLLSLASDDSGGNARRLSVIANRDRPSPRVTTSACTPPPDFPNLRESYTRKVSTSSPEAQGHFDDGMVQFWGFNRAEAAKAFDRALTCDPQCAMCHFGLALAHGPFMNEPSVEASVWATGGEAVTTMQLLTDVSLTEAEQGLVASMAQRYSKAAPSGTTHTAEELTPEEYVQSMAALASQFPEDVDIAVLYADALLASQGYRLQQQYPTQLGSPADDYEHAGEALGRLGDVLDQHHPLGLHLYIHMTEGLTAGRCDEGADCAGLCEGPADALLAMAIDQGHLLHMPSHCFMRVGRYADAAAASLRAAEMNQRYVAAGLAPYLPTHNSATMVVGAMLAGQQKIAMQGAGMTGDTPTLVDLVLLHFAQWEELLKREPAEGAGAVEIFARAMAHAATGDKEGLADGERRLQASVEGSGVSKVLLSALKARKALLEEAEADAVAHLQSAADMQLDWGYSEPPQILSLLPCLGELRLRARDRDVEKAKWAFETDLSLFPDNGYALWGLVELAKAQSKDHSDEQQAFDRAWKGADEPLPNACPMMFTAVGDGMEMEAGSLEQSEISGS